MNAKLFMNGGSQAVRLPREFRFEGDEVEIAREGNGILLRPLKKRSWPENFFESVRVEDPSFCRPSQLPMPVAVRLDEDAS